MERRVLAAAIISILILISFQYLVGHLYPHRTDHPLPGEPVPTAAPAVAPFPAEAPAVAKAQPLQPQAEVKRVTVDTEYYHATFVSTGARLESLQLKQHRSSVHSNSPWQETVVPGQGGELPFGVDLRGAGIVLSDAGAGYQLDGSSLTLHGEESGSVEFVWETEQVVLKKRFTFAGNRYGFGATIGATRIPAEYNELGLSWIKLADQTGKGPVIFDRAFVLDGRKLIEESFTHLADGKIIKGEKGDLTWSGFAGQYFLAAAVPPEGRTYRLWLKLRDRTVEATLLFPIAAPTAEIPLDVYVGPKDVDTLEDVGRELTRAVNFGFFSFIAVPLLHVLQFSHRFTGNYGVDIILLTVLIKILFIPLTNRSFKSMREMQKLQPQMAKIREKYKDSPEQMNKEIMEMYRRHKVNPLGGCLPMVLQIPVFVGLYEALSNAVELRHAPFMLWINDLSAPDRLGSIQLPFVDHPGVPVLTLLMGASMFLQQWMTPSVGDPAQQRVMMIMPLMFTFMFVNFPSGLVLYWLVNNVLTIAQQYYMTRRAAA
jgi:YidC/Oxa1 family membrane protein insertase